MIFPRVYQRYILAALSVILPFMIIWSIYKAINITDYAFVISEYTDEVTQTTKPLPFSRISTPHFSNFQEGIRGSLAVEPFELQAVNNFFIPSYSGNLTISSGGQILFSNLFNKHSPLVNTTSGVMFISNASLPSGILSFVLAADETTFIGLSEVYAGTEEQMMRAKTKFEFIDFMRTVYWGAEAIGIMTLMALFAYAKIRDISSPVLIILIYLFAIQSPGVLVKYFDITAFIAHINSFTFVAILGVVRFYRQIGYGEVNSARPNEMIIALAASFTTLLLCIFYPVLGRIFHLFVTFPALVLALFIVAALSIREILLSGRIEVAILATASLIISLAIGHDILMRIGFFKTFIFLNGTASFCFFISAIFLLLSEVQRSNQRLRDQKVLVEDALEVRTSELRDQFIIQSELREQNAVAVENRRITRDLHDGVLTYLSMIQLLSERSQEADQKDINSLAKDATREIRVIIDSEALDQNSIFLTLSSLRNQVVEPLRNSGIDVDWNLLPLLDQAFMDPMHALDLFRIIQQAIHNAVHRAMCRSLDIYAEVDAIENEIRIYVVNKGGLALKLDAVEGNGIRNMRRRAASIGAMFDLTGIPGGAELVLTFRNCIIPNDHLDPR